MNRKQIEENIGKPVIVNDNGDLMMMGNVKHLIGKQVKVIRLTKGGMARVLHDSGEFSLPPRNLDATK